MSADATQVRERLLKIIEQSRLEVLYPLAEALGVADEVKRTDACYFDDIARFQAAIADALLAPRPAENATQQVAVALMGDGWLARSLDTPEKLREHYIEYGRQEAQASPRPAADVGEATNVDGIPLWTCPCGHRVPVGMGCGDCGAATMRDIREARLAILRGVALQVRRGLGKTCSRSEVMELIHEMMRVVDRAGAGA